MTAASSLGSKHERRAPHHLGRRRRVLGVLLPDPGSICPLSALYAADSAFRAMRRSQIVMDDMWTAEMDEAGGMVGAFLWPAAGVDAADRRLFAASTQAAGSLSALGLPVVLVPSMPPETAVLVGDDGPVAAIENLGHRH